MAKAGEAGGPGIEGIGQIAINVKELERAVVFYRDVLGLHYLFEAPGMAFFDCGGVRLMLSLPSSPEYDHPGSILYYRVGDMEAAHARLAEAGADVVQAPHVVHRTEAYELWMTFVRDPEGNLLALMREVPRE
jgi:catechol 2,3-dioxygenase-like lactoylglutathione lyase family enzyme